MTSIRRFSRPAAAVLLGVGLAPRLGAPEGADGHHHGQQLDRRHVGDVRNSAASHIVHVSAGTITARSPAHGAGPVDVRAKSPVGTSPRVSADRFTYLKRPVNTSVSPRSGPTGEGQKVTILGARLSTALAVYFGTTRATKVLSVSNARIVVRSINHATGAVHLRIRTLGGLSQAVKADRYVFK